MIGGFLEFLEFLDLFVFLIFFIFAHNYLCFHCSINQKSKQIRLEKSKLKIFP